MRKVNVLIAWMALAWVGMGSHVPASAQTPASPASPGAAAQRTAAAAAPETTTPAGDLVGRYCVTCHNEKLAVNGVNANLQLDKADKIHVANSAPTWEKVIVKLRMRAMPPPGNRRPDAETYDKVIDYLQT